MATIAHNGSLPVFMSSAEAASFYGVCRATVRQHAEQLGAVRVGSQWRFPYPDGGDTIRTTDRGSRPYIRRTK